MQYKRMHDPTHDKRKLESQYMIYFHLHPFELHTSITTNVYP